MPDCVCNAFALTVDVHTCTKDIRGYTEEYCYIYKGSDGTKTPTNSSYRTRFYLSDHTVIPDYTPQQNNARGCDCGLFHLRSTNKIDPMLLKTTVRS